MVTPVRHLFSRGPSWSWSYGSWIYNYLCNVVSSNPAHGEVYLIQDYVIKLSVTCDRSMVFSGFSCFLHQQSWPPRYNLNIVDSGVKHHSPNLTLNGDSRYDKFNKISVVFINFVVYFIGHLGLCECKELNDCYTSSVFQVDSLICYYYYYLFYDAIFGNVSIESVALN